MNLSLAIVWLVKNTTPSISYDKWIHQIIYWRCYHGSITLLVKYQVLWLNVYNTHTHCIHHYIYIYIYICTKQKFRPVTIFQSNARALSKTKNATTYFCSFMMIYFVKGVYTILAHAISCSVTRITKSVRSGRNYIALQTYTSVWRANVRRVIRRETPFPIEIDCILTRKRRTVTDNGRHNRHSGNKSDNFSSWKIVTGDSWN